MWRAAVALGAVAAAAGCVHAPGPRWHEQPHPAKLVFARTQVQRAERGGWWSRAALYVAAAAFATGAVIVTSQSGDAIDDPRPLIRAGWITMAAGALGMASGGIGAGYYDQAAWDWHRQLRNLRPAGPP